jgi:hypothetical protein
MYFHLVKSKVMSPEGEQALLQQIARIERRISWIAVIIILVIWNALFFYIRHEAPVEWRLSGETAFWVAFGVSTVVGALLSLPFSKR